jgi:hypothetical protein
MLGADDDENPRPLAVEGRPIYKNIDKYERAGDKNCLEPVWKGHWEELRVDIITALAPALLFVVGFQVDKLKEAALCALHALPAICALGGSNWRAWRA